MSHPWLEKLQRDIIMTRINYESMKNFLGCNKIYSTQMLPVDENIYETDCPILYAMRIIGPKWKLPILWYIADSENETIRYKALERRVVGITATMLTKCLRELESDKLIHRTQYNTIPPTVEYSLEERGRALIPALESVYKWAEEQMAGE